jgi:hypothetical protein
VSSRVLYWDPDKAIAALGLAPGPTHRACNRARFDECGSARRGERLGRDQSLAPV